MTKKTQGVTDILAIKEFIKNHGWTENPANPDQYCLQCNDCVYFIDLYVIDKEER